MSEPSSQGDYSPPPGALLRTLGWPVSLAVLLAELAVTRRGLALLFLAPACVLATTGILRPSLSFDIRTVHLPLGLTFPGTPSAETMLNGPRTIPADSAGLALVGLIGLAVIVLLFRPRRFGATMGLLLVGAACTAASAAINHPALLELMDHENEQRSAIAALLAEEYPDTLVDAGNARVGSNPLSEDARGGLERGRAHLTHGWWLGPWAATGLLFGGWGPLRRRIAWLAAWTVIAAGAATTLCYPRLRAEYIWSNAVQAEARGHFDAARQQARDAIDAYPQFADLERTWLLLGKLDFQQDRSSPEREFFRVSQLQANRDMGRALPLARVLLASNGSTSRAVRFQATDVLAAAGLEQVNQDRPAAAEVLWREALDVMPKRFDCAIYLGIVRAQMDRDAPSRVENLLQPMLDRLADRALAADILDTIGDAYFAAGLLDEARQRYADSLRVFSLPKQINYRAQHGLIGM